MGERVSLLQIAFAVAIALVMGRPATASATAWKAMSFEAFVEEHSDVKGKELAGQYRAAGETPLDRSFMNHTAINSRKINPIQLQ